MVKEIVRSHGLSGIVLLLVMAGVLATRAMGQGDDPGPDFCQSGTDEGCTIMNGCASHGGCTAYDFKPTTTGYYTVSAWTTCNPGNCGHCAACVDICDAMSPNQVVGHCDTIGQDFCLTHQSENCDNACRNIQLTGGKPYIMYVCLIPCPDENGSCEGCVDSIDHCTAHGCVSNDGGTCCQ